MDGMSIQSQPGSKKNKVNKIDSKKRLENDLKKQHVQDALSQPENPLAYVYLSLA